MNAYHGRDAHPEDSSQTNQVEHNKTSDIVRLSLEAVRTLAIIIGVIVIPVVIWRQGNRRSELDRKQQELRDKRRATLHLVWLMVASQELNDRQARIYCYRKFKEKSPESTNPYKSLGLDRFVHDCVITLNIYDSFCIDILHEMVEEDVLYTIGHNAFIGAYENILKLLNDHLKTNLSDQFPHLEKIATRWKARAVEEKLNLVIKIPGGDN